MTTCSPPTNQNSPCSKLPPSNPGTPVSASQSPNPNKGMYIVISEQYDDITQKLGIIEALQNKVLQLENGIEKRDKIISELSTRVCHMEQYSRNTCFEIRELEQEKDEDLPSLAIKVASKLGVSLRNDEIQAVHRLKPKQGKITPIICKLSRQDKCQEIIQNRKKTVVTNQLICGKGEGKVYIGESLSPFYSKLLWEVRQVVKPYNYKFIWYKRYAIHLRKKEDSQIISITNEEDLQSFMRSLNKSPVLQN